jgi:hypothetical protein
MSSWARAKVIPTTKKPVTVSVYHDTSSSPDIPSIYLDFTQAYIFSQKMGENCFVWDPSGILDSTLKYNPQIRFLKEKPEVNPISKQTYKNITESMKIADVQKFARNIFEYDPGFNQSVIQILQKASIKTAFDISLRIVPDASGTNLQSYVDIVKAYQVKSKKARLSIYVMAPSYDVVTAFKTLGDTSWTITSLSKSSPKDAAEAFLYIMAEAQILSVASALILNFDYSIDRFIYMLHRDLKNIEFFREINNNIWSIDR